MLIEAIRGKPASGGRQRADRARHRRAHTARVQRTAQATTRVLGRPAAGGWARPRAAARRRYAVAVPFGSATLALPSLPALSWDWRWMSCALALVSGGLFVHLHRAPNFEIRSIELTGAQWIPAEELLGASELYGASVSSVDPAEVERRLEAVSGVAGATVRVAWPARAVVTVVERTPVLVWEQAGKAEWVDEAGHLFPVRADVPGLLPIVVDDADPTAPTTPVPPDVLRGALQLKSLRPNIERLHYDIRHGLSYQDGRGWRGYFGVGTDMELKLRVYETLVDQLLARQIRPSVVSVEHPQAASYRR